MRAVLRRGRARWIVGSLAVIAGIMACLVVLVESFDPCDVLVHRSIPAPAGKMSAVVFEMGCGATVSFNTQISVAPTDKPFSPRRNPSFLSLREQHDLIVRWSGEKSLEVTVPQGVEVFRKESSAEGVTVEYK